MISVGVDDYVYFLIIVAREFQLLSFGYEIRNECGMNIGLLLFVFSSAKIWMKNN